MKKTTKKISAATLALIMGATAFTGCAGSDTPTTTSGAGNSSATSSTAATGSQKIMSSNENVKSAIDNVSVGDDYKDIKVDTKIKFMAWYDIQEAAPSVELFKAMYGTPKNKPEGYASVSDDNVFVNVKVSNYNNRYVDLAKLVQSDDSPDTFPFETSNYPYGIYQNLFQPIDGVIDTTTDDWAEYKSIIDMFNWGGKVYTPIVDVNPATLLWYRKSIVEENGFDDPWELFEKGEWTWSKCLEMARKFTDPENKTYAFDGFGLDHAFVATTGKPLIGLENGKLVSNLNDANIEKCMEMLRSFDDTQESLRYPREIENGWDVNYNEWVAGNTLFFEDGTWRYEENWRLYKKKKKWDDDEINFVPFPKMDGADTYYQEMKQDAFMFVAGSKNKEGYKAWIYANLLSSKDEEVKKAGRQQSIDEFDWNETLLDRLDKLKDPSTFTAVFEFKNGIGADIADSTNGENPVGHLTADVVMGGNSFASVREENRGPIEVRIKELNATVS